jgi:hypothetical protein
VCVQAHHGSYHGGFEVFGILCDFKSTSQMGRAAFEGRIIGHISDDEASACGKVKKWGPSVLRKRPWGIF